MKHEIEYLCKYVSCWNAISYGEFWKGKLITIAWNIWNVIINNILCRVAPYVKKKQGAWSVLLRIFSFQFLFFLFFFFLFWQISSFVNKVCVLLFSMFVIINFENFGMWEFWFCVCENYVLRLSFIVYFSVFAFCILFIHWVYILCI